MRDRFLFKDSIKANSILVKVPSLMMSEYLFNCFQKQSWFEFCGMISFRTKNSEILHFSKSIFAQLRRGIRILRERENRRVGKKHSQFSFLLEKNPLAGACKIKPCGYYRSFNWFEKTFLIFLLRFSPLEHSFIESKFEEFFISKILFQSLFWKKSFLC